MNICRSVQICSEGLGVLFGRRALAEGDLTKGADSARLARYVMTLSFGLAVQVAGEAEVDELLGVVEEVLAAWRSSRAHG
ncbi:hypothetical protein CLV43_105429 [Umezawaea tangerina]|uniref:Tetracyclin repressor-like C-terminal domain-containing protein n=1 Tax=Umezawaea tangerina TaxID=84725 RepID=A0A2T0T7R0_9PSEU|nr:hypothetical protein CLV43_105429 [Umezawaea tangerina]